MAETFIEKILGAKEGSIVFKRPDLILTHDNSASIRKTFEKMKGKKVYDPGQLLIVLDHNAPPTNAKLANDYQSVRDFSKEQKIQKFYDEGKGICHQIMAGHARPGMIIVGSDSHTCTAGAFNVLAAGIDRTEAAGLWKTGETWFMVPESIMIWLEGKLPEGVYAKDLSLWLIGMIGSEGANYMSMEFHGPGVENLEISDRMTLANLASEMGAKNAVFPLDEKLASYYRVKQIENGVWADPEAKYARKIEIDMSSVFPLVAVPHQVENIKSLAEVKNTTIQQGLIGTCTNGRIEDLRIAAEMLRNHKLAPGFRLHIIPASQEIYLQALKEGLIEIFIRAGAAVLSSSCGPCLGTGQGIPADDVNVISTANRNFKGRMGNPNASIYLASPATVACSAINGKITDPRKTAGDEHFPFPREIQSKSEIQLNDFRKTGNVWDYSDINNLNTDQMFAGSLTYNILSSDPPSILPHLFKGFDENFAENVSKGDIIIAGENFGCGSSREHPAVGLSYAGIKAVIVKSVNRIFYRSAINQGLLLIVNPSAVEEYKKGDSVGIYEQDGKIYINARIYDFPPLPEKIKEILDHKGLVNWMLNG